MLGGGKINISNFRCVRRYKPIAACNTLITQSNLNLTFILMIYTRIPIYQALTHPWKQSGMPEPVVQKNSQLSFFLSFSLLGLTQGSLDHSPKFSYKSTPFCSAQCSITLVLCYHDNYVMVGLVSASYDWVCLVCHFDIVYNAHAHNVIGASGIDRVSASGAALTDRQGARP